MERIMVSEEWLKRLQGELSEMDRRRTALRSQLSQIDSEIMAQMGAVGLMQELLRPDETPPDETPPDETPPDETPPEA
jgi:hypothetical protein